MPLATAKIKTKKTWVWLWLLPLSALIFSIIMTLQAKIEQGQRISIRFQQGYGLKVGDPLRYRGIIVGKVESVLLSDNGLKHINVTIRLRPEAKDIARVGSVFWIVRPEVGIAKIGGLDTLLGSKYLKVLPGNGANRNAFIGHDHPPLYKLASEEGLEVMLQARDKGGVYPGALVKYRQYPIGVVLSVELASDSSAIETRVLIEPEYTVLIRTNTVFWKSGGIKAEGGIGGFSLQVDSLQDLINGGISLAVPDEFGDRVKPGHRFILSKKAKNEWLNWKPVLALRDNSLINRPHLAMASLSWQNKKYGFIVQDRIRQGSIVAIEGGWLGLSELLQTPNGAIKNTTQLSIDQKIVSAVSKNAEQSKKKIRFLAAPVHLKKWSGTMRILTVPEDVFIVGGSSLSIKQISASRLSGEKEWLIDQKIILDSAWHGAAVISALDNALIGFLSVNEDQAVVILLDDDVLSNIMIKLPSING